MNTTYKRKYWSNDKLYSEVPYANGKRNGLYKCWYHSGKMQAEIPHVNGKQHGLRKWWNPSGELTHIDLYNNGIYLMELKSISTPIHPNRKIRFK